MWRIAFVAVCLTLSVQGTVLGQEFSRLYGADGHWGAHFTLTGQYDVFAPITRPAPWPVVCFMHGAGGEFPAADQGPAIETMWPFLGEWCARNGFLVIVPRYQADKNRKYEHSVFRPPNQLFRVHDWQWRAEHRMVKALDWLRAHNVVDEEKFALVGHSLGTMISLKVANLQPLRASVPMPKTLVLIDPAGYEFGPLLSNNPHIHFNRFGLPYNTDGYESFPNISTDTNMVCLIAEDTWHYSHGYSAPGISYGNNNAGGVVSRAFHSTPCARKQISVFLGDPINGAPNEHGSAVDGSPHMEYYWRHVADACRDAFGGPLYSASNYAGELHRWWLTIPYRPKSVAIANVPDPAPYQWNTGMELPEATAALLDWIVEMDPIVERSDLEDLIDLLAGMAGMEEADFFGNGVSWHILDTLVGGKLAMQFLVPQTERDSLWYSARYGLDIYLRNLPAPFDVTPWDTEWPY